MKTGTLMLALLLLSISGVSQQITKLTEYERVKQLEPPQGKIRMVLDTDTYTEIDDQFALVYALISPDKLDVQAIYAAPFFKQKVKSPGEAMEKSYEEILQILGKLKISSDNFVFRGSTDFIQDVNNPEKSPATLDLIKKAKEGSPENPLYVVAIGAISNVANAILLDPSIIKNIVIVWLGGNGHSWQNQNEYNFRLDINAVKTIFDCGVPLVQVPCTPVVTHLTTTVPEMELYVGGRGAIGDYLVKIFKEYRNDHFAWSKVLWDMSAIAYVINPDWTPTSLVHSPLVNDNLTLSFDNSRHFIRVVYFVNRDDIFRDFFTKIDKLDTP
jgi:purine nucleosidase